MADSGKQSMYRDNDRYLLRLLHLDWIIFDAQIANSRRNSSGTYFDFSFTQYRQVPLAGTTAACRLHAANRSDVKKS